jgi:spermidine synthase
MSTKPLFSQKLPFIFSIVVVLSGISGLGYQMAWSKMLAVALGHEVIAMLAVIAAFFIGLALGALLLNKAVKKTTTPQRWYAICELVIGVWSLLLITIIPYFNETIAGVIGVQPTPFWHWFVTFLSTLLLLLPATFCMGATLPAIERVFTSLLLQSGKISGLYGLNTFGAMMGALLATFYFIPAFGLSSTLTIFAIINLFCGAAMLLIWRRTYRATDSPSSPHLHATLQEAASKEAISTIRTQPLLFTLFMCGWLGLGFEVLAIRALSQILENTVFTFAAVLCIYLLGTALGAAWYQLFMAKKHAKQTAENWQTMRFNLLCLSAIMCSLGTFALWLGYPVYIGIVALLGYGAGSAIIAELLVAMLVLFCPTFAMGMLFSHLIKCTLVKPGLGISLGVNTLGSALAPLTFGILILPMVGSLNSLLIVCVSYLCLIPFSGVGSTKAHATIRHLIKTQATALLIQRNILKLAIPLSLCGLLLILPLPNNYVTWKSNDQQLYYNEGVMAAIEINVDSAGNKHLSVNNHYTMGGTASRFSDHRQTHLPFLLHGSPKSALFLGLGTGITMDAGQYYPSTHITGVELIPELLPILNEFDVNINSNQWYKTPTLISADARRYMLSTEQTFDVVIAEIFHPSRDGAGALYTVEHFQQVRKKLNPDGLFCQWLPLFQLDIPTFQTILRSFLVVFPNAQMHLGHFSLKQPILCLVGTQNEYHIAPNWLVNNVTHVPLQQQLIESKLNSDMALLGGFLASGEVLATLAGSGPLNTDDHPFVTYQAPDFVYQTQQLPAQRLLEILMMLPLPKGAEITNDKIFGAELEQYWLARNLFLQAGVNVSQEDDVMEILVKTYPQLITSVKTSTNFEPAYRALMGMATQIYPLNPNVALNLLDELNAVAPMYTDARELREQLQ